MQTLLTDKINMYKETKMVHTRYNNVSYNIKKEVICFENIRLHCIKLSYYRCSKLGVNWIFEY